MELYVIFGLPGAGKTFVGKILEEEFGFYIYEADEAMPHELQTAIREQQLINDNLRDSFFEKIIEQVKKLQTEHTKLAVTQVFIKEKYRKQFLEAFPQAKFILIQTPDAIRENRLLKQKTWQLDVTYWRKMAEIFEEPAIPHVVIQNNNVGEEKLKNQLFVILERNKVKR